MDFEKIFILLLAVIAAVMDFFTYKISNKLVIVGITGGIICQVLKNGLEGIVFSLAGGVTPILCLWIFFLLRYFGAGDIKLLCALGCMMGPVTILYLIGLSIIIGGIIGTMKLIIYDSHQEKATIRFAIPIFISVLMYIGGVI